MIDEIENARRVVRIIGPWWRENLIYPCGCVLVRSRIVGNSKVDMECTYHEEMDLDDLERYV